MNTEISEKKEYIQSKEEDKYITFVGKIRKVLEEGDMTLEEWSKNFYKEKGVTELNDYYDGSWFSLFEEEHYETHITVKGSIYEIVESKYFNTCEFGFIEPDRNDLISFVLRYDDTETTFEESLYKLIKSKNEESELRMNQLSENLVNMRVK